MNYTPRQLHTLGNVETDSARRLEKARKSDSEHIANLGPKTIKYNQTDTQRVIHKALYLIFAITSFLLTGLVFFLADFSSSVLWLLSIIISGLLGLFHIYCTTSQLVIRDAMTETMYDLAVKRFQRVNILFAITITITALITILASHSDTENYHWVYLAGIVVSCVLAWLMPILEKCRTLVACQED